MKRTIQVELLVFGILVAAGTAIRCLFHADFPNFAPVAAIALFGGYYFRSAWLAALAPLAIMEISNRLIPDGGYQSGLVMLAVYGSLAAPVLVRSLVRRLELASDSPWRSLASLVAMVGMGAGSSVLFFLTTNLAVWLGTNMYEHTLGGLARCYLMAVPFFRYTLLGDVLFSVVLFTGYLAATSWSLRGERAGRLAEAA